MNPEVTEGTIKKVAKACRLRLNEKDTIRFKKDFEEVLSMLSILEEADTSDISDDKVVLTPFQAEKKPREDIIEDKSLKAECLKLTKHRTEEYFKGPKVF
jgi:aspartyl/glutamyl-tRNA(Asn/Gln) amidotransferase C subunit